jgi:hypothetical protein
MTVLDRLRASDPAQDHDPPADERLLQQLVAEPRTLPRRRRTVPARRILAVGAVAAAALAAVAVVDGGGPAPDLAARAYAQTSAAEQILYARTRTETVMTRPDGDQRSDYVAEYWNYGKRAHYRTTGSDHNHPATTFEMTVAEDGTVRARQTAGPAAEADWRTISADESLDFLRRGFVAEFRMRYERGQLDPAGDATFAGHAAQRYVVDHDGLRSEYYVDAQTAEPLGVIHTFRFAIRPDGPLVGAQRTVTSVEQISHLEPTPENLAKLT